jgi:hypothetical protein
MARQHGERFSRHHLIGSADERGRKSRASRRWQRLLRIALNVTTAAILATALAPPSGADPTASLKSGVDAARGAAGCPPFQPDPVLDEVAQRANRETDSYLLHTARFTPFEDPMPVLRDLGYNTSKAKMLLGYGDVDAKAIRGLVIEGFAALPDCTYTKYGMDALSNDDDGYVLTSLVLAGL